MGTRILTVEDDERIRTAVKLALEDEGWAVEEAASGEEALEAFGRQPADVVLIDIMLPGIDGFELCRSIRGSERRADRHGHRPRRHPRRRRRPRGRRRRLPHQAVRAEGAVRPHPGPAAPGPDRGPAATHAAVRRPRDHPRRGRRCARAATELHLTKTEFRLLCELASSPGRVFSREVLLDRVWGYGYFGDGRLVDVHVRRLRTKVEADPANPRHVVTVRGLGYGCRREAIGMAAPRRVRLSRFRPRRLGLRARITLAFALGRARAVSVLLAGTTYGSSPARPLIRQREASASAPGRT